MKCMRVVSEHAQPLASMAGERRRFLSIINRTGIHQLFVQVDGTQSRQRAKRGRVTRKGESNYLVVFERSLLFFFFLKKTESDLIFVMRR